MPLTKAAQQLMNVPRASPPPLPPTTALRAFEAAARLGSFAAAAQELNLTAGAISHQIKALEGFMRVPLFSRHRQRVQLNESGLQLLPAVQQAIHGLQDAISSVQLKRSKLRITVLPSIAHRFLLSRLAAFVGQHPELDLHMTSSQALTDLRGEGCDLGLRFGQGKWANLYCERLANESLVPVVAPELIQHGRAQGLGILSRLPLLRDEHHPWAPYLQQLGASSAKVRFATKYGDSAQLLESAESGHGVALARWWLARDALAKGTLTTFGLPPLHIREAYYVVAPAPIDTLNGASASMTSWLRHLFADDTAPSSAGYVTTP